jgi:hypothetical protein
MKKNLLSFGVCALLATGASAQGITGTVSIGAGYANQKWYSFQNGEVGTAQPKDNWDIAFEITGISSAIFANTQKANFAVYKTPYEIADYAILDTTGISGWATLQNSDTTWTVGAFNRGKDPADAFDMGWGVYDMNTHHVKGDSCFVIKLSATSYKKFKIESLASGVYTFEYADLNGANSFTQTIAKTAYTGKNFAYFDLTSNSAIDREPASADWDLTFVRYSAEIAPGMYYPVVGILQNKGVSVAQVNNVANPQSFVDTNQVFRTNISTIGHDWKSINIATNVWGIVNDTVYLVRDKAKDIWKVRPIAFGGSADGNYVFSAENLALLTTGIAGHAGQAVSQVMIYPNPASGDHTNLIFSSDKAQTISVSVIDMNGRTLATESIEAAEGLTTHHLSTAGLSSGVYFISLNAGSYTSIQKLIVR